MVRVEVIFEHGIGWHVGLVEDLVGSDEDSPGVTESTEPPLQLDPFLEPGVLIDDLSLFKGQGGIRVGTGLLNEGLIIESRMIEIAFHSCKSLQRMSYEFRVSQSIS